MPVSWLTIAMTQAACVSSMPSRTTAVGAAGTGAGAGAAAGAEAASLPYPAIAPTAEIVLKPCAGKQRNA